MLNFRDGDPGDFVLTWRSIDPKKQRTYTAKYSGGELTGSKLQLGSNFLHWNMTKTESIIHAVFGESTNARRATYEEGEEFSVGAIGRHELYRSEQAAASYIATVQEKTANIDSGVRRKTTNDL